MNFIEACPPMFVEGLPAFFVSGPVKKKITK
jgi:hypothetical protein